jgi:hypothetical protein
MASLATRIWKHVWLWIDWHGRISTFVLLVVAAGGATLVSRALTIWSSVSGVYLWVISGLVFALLIATMAVAGSKLRPMPSQGQRETQSDTSQPPLREVRPKIIPVKYGQGEKHSPWGLHLRNAGYDALDIEIPDAPIGSSGYTLEFPGRLAQLGERSGTGFLEAWLKHGTLPGTDGSQLHEVMRNADIESIGVSILYKDTDLHPKKTECVIERTNRERHGLSVRAISAPGIPAQSSEPTNPAKDKPNLRADLGSAPIGPVFLASDGVWSASYSVTSERWTGLRMKVSNALVDGRQVGTARDVSVRVKFEYDTGVDSGCAAPTAWLHEKRGYVDINPGEEKQAIIAVCSDTEWHTVTNVRDASGYPPDRSAIHFQDATVLSGKLHITLIRNGVAEAEQSYSWECGMLYVGGTYKAGIPHIRLLS